MNLAIPVLPRLNVSIRIVSGTIVYEFNLIPDLWIGLDWVSKNEPMSNSAVGR